MHVTVRVARLPMHVTVRIANLPVPLPNQLANLHVQPMCRRADLPERFLTR
jgi:hypothetical protein